MANMALNIEQRLGQKLTPEQQILWQSTLLITGENLRITPLCYFGDISTSELFVYSANKLYIAYAFSFTAAASLSAAESFVIFYNENNALNYVLGNNSMVWDTTAAVLRFYPNSVTENNMLFSRLHPVTVVNCRFIGYRLNF